MGEEIRLQAFRIVEKLPYRTMLEALADPERSNAEGIVVRFIGSDQRVKLKYPQYVALHRIVTGMNERAVWLRLSTGDSISDIQRDLPEEFWPWVSNVGTDLLSKARSISSRVDEEYRRILYALPPGWGRAEFAARAKESKYTGLLFSTLDRKDIRPAVWKLVRPEAGKSMTAASD